MKEKVNSTYERSLAKAVSWESISFIVTFLLITVLYGDVVISLKFSLLLSCIKIVLFFFHERAWKKVGWGRC